VIVGTAAYMSPEQARGLPVDRRTDVWAFGCVLYELLTGRTAFAERTVTDTLSAVLHREPDWTALPPGLPASILVLLRRCLEKDQRRRRRDMADVRAELDDAIAEPADGSGAGARPPAPARRALRATLLAAKPESADAPVLVTRYSPSRVPLWPAGFALSPDDRWLAVTLRDGGTTNIWAIPTDGGAYRQITDFGRRPTLIARQVSWSKDGKFIYAALTETDSDIALLAGLAFDR
jgi:serine/threonine protein kinase